MAKVPGVVPPDGTDRTEKGGENSVLIREWYRLPAKSSGELQNLQPVRRAEGVALLKSAEFRDNGQK